MRDSTSVLILMLNGLSLDLSVIHKNDTVNDGLSVQFLMLNGLSLDLSVTHKNDIVAYMFLSLLSILRLTCNIFSIHIKRKNIDCMVL